MLKLLPLLVGCLSLPLTGLAADDFRAGVAAVDISPTTFPRIIAGGFLEGKGERLADRLHVRCFVLDDGKTTIAFAIVDTCMMTQALIDEAKELASRECGIAVDHMIVSATHTHSAPAAMGCLGTRKDSEYAKFLVPKIAEGIVAASKNLQPARVGWASVDDWEHTHNRRWIRRIGAEVVDPFGEKTGRANMHPGYLSKDVIGPSGPLDPQLSVISLQTKDGKPLGVLANYSQHYFGSGPVSADYYGAFCRHIAAKLCVTGEGSGPFVCAISQGTSGDLMWMDYGSAKRTQTMDSYAEAVAANAMQALKKVEYHDSVPLGIVEKKLPLSYRVPDGKRLAWAKPIAAKIENDLPKNKEEVYAREAVILHERQKTSLKLQAIRIGELTIATLPNEVYAITGLKLKAQAPLAAHFNIELANGAEGYIPPPEQHALGGYTTWPARTAGLEVQAEPKEVETLLAALDEVTGKPHRAMQSEHGAYAKAVLDSKPAAYWRLDEAAGRIATNAVSGGPNAQILDGAAWYLPGVGSGTGYGSGEALKPSAFSGEKQINRALHLSGGRVESALQTGKQASIALWFWLGHASGAGERSGTIIEALGAKLTARQTADHRVRLALGDTTTKEGLHADDWHFAVLVRDGDQLLVHLDGDEKPAITGKADGGSAKLIFGSGLQGKLDEIALWRRAIEPALIAQLWKTSGVAADHARNAVERVEHAKLATAQSSASLKQHESWSVSMRFRNTKKNNVSAVTAYLVSRGPKGDHQAPGDHLGIGGNYKNSEPGKLFVFNGNAADQIVRGKTIIEPGSWNDVTLERTGSHVKVTLNGKVEIDAELPVTAHGAKELFVGQRCDDFAPLEGEFEKVVVAGLQAPKNTASAPPPKLELSSQPLPPGESLKKLHVREGFKAEIIACEPVVLDPVAFDWDERGRLWVIEMADYPLGMDGKGKSGSRVVMLEDTDANGQYDKRTVIADGLNFATGILTWRDGVLVTAAPDILFIKNDGSGRKVLFTGFSEGNQQLRVNGLRWGMDGWVYCAGGAHTVSYNKSTAVVNKLTGEKIELGARDFRFKPDTGEFDPQTGPAQFGRVRDDWSHWFGVQNSKPLWHYVLQDHYLRRSPNVIPPDPIRQMYRLNPPVYAASAPEKRYHSFDHATAYTSACGINFYRGGTLFDDGKMHAFTCEPFHNLAQHHIVEDDGVSFKVHPDTDGKVPDFFASEDRWCRPVMMRDGPDGALYVADMYRYMIEHPQWLPQNGRDELLPFYRHGEDKGRIYRISKIGDRPQPVTASMDAVISKTGDALQPIAALASPSGWLRDKAQMLLTWRQPKDVEERLAAMIARAKLPQARAQAAWTLHLLGRMTPRICERLLADPHPRVREQGLIIAENFPNDAALANAMVRLAGDDDAKVRLQLAFSATQTATLATLLRRDAADPIIAGSVLLRRGLLDELNDETLKTIAPAILASGDQAMIDHWIGRVGRDATDREAVMMLATSVKHRASAVAQAEAWLRPQSPMEDQRRALAVLTIAHPAQAFAWMTSDWNSRTPESRREIVGTLLNEAGWTRSFLKIAAPNDFDASQRATLLNHPDKSLATLAAGLFKSEPSPSRAAVLEKFKPALTLSGDAARGKQVFATAGCIACHQLEGSGLPVGPDLRSVVQHTPDKLFNSVLDPSAIIEPGFAVYHCTLKNGEQLYGIVATETAGSVTMKLAGNITRAVLRSDIAALKSTKASLMPDGLEGALTPQSLADLIAYLKLPK